VIPAVVRGENWARWAALAGALALLIPLLYVTVSGRIATGAAYPIVPTVIALVLAVVAFVAARTDQHAPTPQAGGGLRHAPPAS